MIVEPNTWRFQPSQSFCCYKFNEATDEYGYNPAITTDGRRVYFRGQEIQHCPYCGTKITLEKKC